MRTKVPRENGKKPDPDEPWRYVCPSCGGQVSGRSTSVKYECSSCGVLHGAAELYDRKTGGRGVA